MEYNNLNKISEIVMKLHNVIIELEDACEESDSDSMYVSSFIASKIFTLCMKEFMKSSVICPSRWNDFLESTSKCAKDIHKKMLISKKNLNKNRH